MALAPLTTVDRSALRWLRTREHPDAFALLAGDQTIATLEWPERGSSLAVARSAAAEWSLKREGFLNPHILAKAGESNVARLTVHFNYHQIEVAGGRRYRFHRAGVLVPAWTVSSDDGHELMHLEPVREGRRLTAGAVVVSPEAVDLPDLVLLAFLSWFFIVLAWFEDEAVETLASLEDPDGPVPRSG